MKKFIISLFMLGLLINGTTIKAQNQPEESLGLPGDNLNLYAVMKLFRESATLEEFEKNLNDENSKINNLDLNGDNMVDYIRVIDNIDRDVHNIVLQVAVNQRENQDVAVFTVQHDPYGKVQIQLTGDEALYGKDYIIEPVSDDVEAGQTPNPGYRGIDGRYVTAGNTTTVEISAWPLIRFIYLPNYSIWHSPWYFGYYPPYWRPWHPYFWDYYYGYHYHWYNNYYAHYHRGSYHHFNGWNDYYWTSRRSYSANVNQRIGSGNYKNTYSRPDQRRDGEALYSRMNPSQNSRRSDHSSGSNNVRRSGTRSIPDRQSGVTGSSRRSSNAITNKPVPNLSSDQNRGTNRRSASTITNKPVPNRSSDQNTGTNRRSANSITNKSVSNPSSGQNTVRKGSSRQSATPGVNSRSRKSKGNNKSSATSKKLEKTKEPESSKPSRRQ